MRNSHWIRDRSLRPPLLYHLDAQKLSVRLRLGNHCQLHSLPQDARDKIYDMGDKHGRIGNALTTDFTHSLRTRHYYTRRIDGPGVHH